MTFSKPLQTIMILTSEDFSYSKCNLHGDQQIPLASLQMAGHNRSSSNSNLHHPFLNPPHDFAIPATTHLPIHCIILQSAHNSLYTSDWILQSPKFPLAGLLEATESPLYCWVAKDRRSQWSKMFPLPNS
jgi:hypothetical protein